MGAHHRVDSRGVMIMANGAESLKLLRAGIYEQMNVMCTHGYGSVTGDTETFGAVVGFQR
jgi:hypothetical protein